MSEPGTDPNERLLEIRRQLAEGGGAERVKTQHARGKKTARERVEMLLDAGSFQEMDAFMIHRSTDFGMEKSHARRISPSPAVRSVKWRGSRWRASWTWPCRPAYRL